MTRANLIFINLLFAFLFVSCSLGIDGLSGNSKESNPCFLTVNFDATSGKSVVTNFIPVNYALFTLTGPDGSVQQKEWHSGDPVSLIFRSDIYGNHTLTALEIFADQSTNIESVVFSMQAGFNYYISVDLEKMVITSNENQDHLDSNMILVQGGTYDYSKNGIPVTLTYDMYVSRYETVFDEWVALTNTASVTNMPYDNGWGMGRRPLLNVSWYDAVDFCNWKSLASGLKPAYDGQARLLDTNGQVTTDLASVEGYRLMTEWEWEYVAREKGTVNYSFAGGNDINLVAWWSDNCGGMTQAVGSKTPTLSGFFDMTGNVSEWCFNEPTTYTSAVTNPVGFNSQYEYLPGSKDTTITGVIEPIVIPVTKIYRGGSFSDTSKWGYFFLLINTLLGDSPTNKTPDKGFRVVRTKMH